MAEIIEGTHDFSPEEKYVMPTEKEVLDHLEWFKDQKLGFMMHWAPGSQFSVIESWSLASKSPWDSSGSGSQPREVFQNNRGTDAGQFRFPARNPYP